MNIIRIENEPHWNNARATLGPNDISFSILKIQNTEESFVVLQPPPGRRFFLFQSFFDVTSAFVKLSEQRTKENQSLINSALKKSGWARSAPFMGSCGHILIDFICPDKYLDDFYFHFREQARYFGTDCLLNDNLKTHLVPNGLPDDLPSLVNLLKEIEQGKHESAFWRYLETDEGKQFISIWICNNIHCYWDDLNKKHAVFARISRFLGWFFLYTMLDMEYLLSENNPQECSIPTGRFYFEGLAESIDYREEINKFRNTVMVDFPILFTPVVK